MALSHRIGSSTTDRRVPVQVLIVEDDPGDVLMIREAFEYSHLAVSLSVVNDGVLALDFLRRQGAFASSPSPDLICST